MKFFTRNLKKKTFLAGLAWAIAGGVRIALGDPTGVQQIGEGILAIFVRDAITKQEAPRSAR